MKKTFPLGEMTDQETEALDSNREQYKRVLDFTASYKESFLEIEIKQFENEFFYGLHCVFKAAGLYDNYSFAALRKWGTYTSLAECKTASIQEVKWYAKDKKKGAIINKLKLRDLFNED